MDTCSTTLNLLTREGAMTVTFVPPLEPNQYDELSEVVVRIETPHELMNSMKSLGRKWNRDVTIDPC